MPLKKTDDIGDWIKDFYKSDAPQFDGASKEKRRKMAIAAYLSAQESFEDLRMAINHIIENDEYDGEGSMAKSQLKTLLDAGQQLHDMLADDTNLPEWVQGKITKATDYIDTARDYMQSELEDGKAPIVDEVEESDEYMKGVAKDKKDDRERAFKKQAKMSDDDPDAYKPVPGDKDKDGELKKTKLSKHTKKYRQMYGEDVKTIKVGADALTAEEQPHYALVKNRKVIAVGEKEELLQRCEEEGGRVWLTTCKENEIVEELQIDEKIKGLENKSKKSGIPYGILKQVYDRGMAAWKGGHRPGATQQQWAFARVNSFITKGKGTWGGADKDLASKVRKEHADTKTEMVERMLEIKEKKKGLWANMHAKRKRGEAPAKPGDPDYPEKLPEDGWSEMVICPKCQGDGCTHCDGKGFHMQERKSTVPELMQVNIKGEGGVTVKAKTEKEALKIALKKMKIQPRFANDKKFMAKVQIIPAESVEEVQPVEENKLKDLAIQFADEMKELSKLIKNRKNKIAAQSMAKMIEKGNMQAASKIFQNLDTTSKTIVAGSFASLFGDATAKRYGITEDTLDYADYISKNTFK